MDEQKELAARLNAVVRDLRSAHANLRVLLDKTSRAGTQSRLARGTKRRRPRAEPKDAARR